MALARPSASMWHTAAIAALGATLVGCATIHPDKMVPDPTPEASQHDRSVALRVTGGTPGVTWYSRTVSRADFEEALRRSVERTRIFNSIADDATADYILNVDLGFSGSHPGFNMTAWLNARWALVSRSTGATVWGKEIKGDGTASMGEAFNGATRQCIALERAAKANIQTAFADIEALSLP